MANTGVIYFRELDLSVNMEFDLPYAHLVDFLGNYGAIAKYFAVYFFPHIETI